MGKGSTRRPQLVSDKQVQNNWKTTFKKAKERKDAKKDKKG